MQAKQSNRKHVKPYNTFRLPTQITCVFCIYNWKMCSFSGHSSVPTFCHARWMGHLSRRSGETKGSKTWNWWWPRWHSWWYVLSVWGVSSFIQLSVQFRSWTGVGGAAMHCLCLEPRSKGCSFIWAACVRLFGGVLWSKQSCGLHGFLTLCCAIGVMEQVR